MSRIDVVKALFKQEFPEAYTAILSGTEHERTPAEAMYAAFKKGYTAGLNEVKEAISEIELK